MGIFLFDVAAYAAGLAAFAGLVLFVAPMGPLVMDLSVAGLVLFVAPVGPLVMDLSVAGPTLTAVLVDASLVALFGVQHSVMARDGFKRRLARVVPAAAERSVYVLATALLLALAFVAWRPLPAVVWEAHGLAAGALLTICVAGWTLVLASTFAIDHFDLFGLRQAWLHLRGRPYTPVAMKSPRLYRVVRHPMMLGMLVALFATPTMTAGHLLFASAMGVYVLIGIAFEERALLAAHGEAYARYRREVPMLLPLPRRSSPGGGSETSESSTR